MRATRVLTLNRETLAELTSAELTAVAGAAAPETRDERCVSGVIQCTTDRVTELLTVRTAC